MVERIAEPMKNTHTDNFQTLKNELLNDIILWISVTTTLGVALSVSRILVIGWKPVMGLHIMVLVSIWSLWFGRRLISYCTRILGLLALLWIVSTGGFIQFGPIAQAGVLVVSFSFIAVLFLGNQLAWWLIAVNILSIIMIGIAASRHRLEFDLDYPIYAHHPITWLNTIWTYSSYSLIFALFGWNLLNWLLDRERVIRQEHDLKQYYLDNTQSVMVLLDNTGRITMINRKACELLGREESELLGRNWFEHALPQPSGMETSYPRFLAIMSAAEPVVAKDESPVACPDGTERLIAWENAYLADDHGQLKGVLSSGMDITERKKAEAELQQHRDHLEETVETRTLELQNANQKLSDTVFALESVGTAILWVEADTGQLLSVNQHASNLLGYTQDEMTELSVTDIDPSISRETYLKIAAEIRAKSFIRFDTVIMHKNGQLFSVELRVHYKASEAGLSARHIAFAVDISGRKLAEQALREAKEAAEAASEAKSLFLANMSHEIRTPVSAILGFTDLGLGAGPTERQRGYLTKIKTASSHLLSLVNNILDFSKIEADMLTLEELEFDLDRVLENLGLVMGDKAANRGLELVFDGDADLPRRLVGDPLRLSQILMNLVGNAIKFSEQGTIIVCLRVESWEGKSLMLRVAVSDEGCGLSPEQQAGLFTPFHQVDASTTRRYGGTGLGLVISKRLVELMEGHIWVDSELGQGTTFQFTIRLDVADLDSSANPALTHHAGRRLLVIDKNLATRRALEGQLRHLGLVAETYASWDAITKEHFTENDPYLCILIDEALPEFQNASPLREWAAKNGLPLIPLASHHRSDSMEGALFKPITMTRLEERIIDLIGSGISAGPDRAVTPALGDAALMAKSLGKIDILLVEDTEINREMMVELLQDLGLSVRWAVNGLEALREVEAKPPDAILMDCQMPVMDGYAATRKLRTQERFADLPIIALTANALSSDRDNCLAAGMNDYLSKPVDLTELIRLLVRHVKPQVSDQVQTITPKPSPPKPPIAELPGIDVRVGLARTNHNQALYFRLLRKFRDNYCHGFEANFQGALDNGDWQTAQRLAHSLKGTARTLGVELLGELAAQLEAAVKQAEPGAIPESLAILVTELQKVGVGLDGLGG